MEFAWRSKLRRAEEHLAAFELACQDYLAASHVGFSYETDPGAGRIEVRLESDWDPPMSLGVIAGDALQNLRSALDAIAWETCRRAGVSADVEHRVYFPIVGQPARWPSEASRKLPGVGGEALDVFKQLQPWHYDEIARGLGINVDPSSAEHHPLQKLHLLARHDRHRVPHPILARAGNTWLGSPDGVEVTVEAGDPPPWRAGGLVLAWRVSPPERVADVAPAGEAVLAFSEEAAMAGRSAAAELRMMHDSVASALRRVEIEVLEVVSSTELEELRVLQRAQFDAEEAFGAFRSHRSVIDASYLSEHQRLTVLREEARAAYTRRWRELFQ